MNFDFDTTIPREGTNCVKYDLRGSVFGREDVIPMWVADMDFAVPPFVAEAVRRRAEHPIYAYSFIPDSYYDAIINWQLKRFNWQLKKDWIRFSPGVVTGLNMIIQGLTEPGDKVIVQPPVYFPFFFCVEKNGRNLLLNRLKENDGIYSIDFEDLETKMKDGARMLVISNPHNPVSRCWTKEELEWIGSKCIEHGVILVSDEIHCDLVLRPFQHTPVATLSEKIAQNTVTCIAPSKTFNLAGLFTSSIIIQNEKLREKFKTSEERLHLSPNIFGVTAAEAAYREGDKWLEELLGYLGSNVMTVLDFLAAELPEIKVSPAEATYMLWLDFRRLGIPDPELKKLLIEKAGLGFVDGPTFGPGGEGFQRMNIGCPNSILIRALESLRAALK
jgi:cysteine-S-conjugate beta-lyase